jgi:hypothetical protein
MTDENQKRITSQNIELVFLFGTTNACEKKIISTDCFVLQNSSKLSSMLENEASRKLKQIKIKMNCSNQVFEPLQDYILHSKSKQHSQEEVHKPATFEDFCKTTSSWEKNWLNSIPEHLVFILLCFAEEFKWKRMTYLLFNHAQFLFENSQNLDKWYHKNSLKMGFIDELSLHEKTYITDLSTAGLFC